MKTFLLLILFLFTFSSEVNSEDTEQRLKQLEKRIYELEVYMEMYTNYTHQRITITAYHPKSGGINSDKTPDRTAIMRKPIAGYTLAISTELFNMGWLNKRIYIDGWGVGKATDRMSISIKGKHIDICFPTLKAAKKFGVKRNILAVLLQ